MNAPEELNKIGVRAPYWMAQIYDADGQPFGRIYGLTKEQAEATAQLLAAAWGLREKSRNIFKRYQGELPTPYGHDCQWCGLCCQRAVEEFLAALAKADGKV